MELCRDANEPISVSFPRSVKLMVHKIGKNITKTFFELIWKQNLR